MPYRNIAANLVPGGFFNQINNYSSVSRPVLNAVAY
jgi:hypothetical protein